MLLVVSGQLQAGSTTLWGPYSYKQNNEAGCTQLECNPWTVGTVAQDLNNGLYYYTKQFGWQYKGKLTSDIVWLDTPNAEGNCFEISLALELECGSWCCSSSGCPKDYESTSYISEEMADTQEEAEAAAAMACGPVYLPDWPDALTDYLVASALDTDDIFYRRHPVTNEVIASVAPIISYSVCSITGETTFSITGYNTNGNPCSICPEPSPSPCVAPEVWLEAECGCSNDEPEPGPCDNCSCVNGSCPDECCNAPCTEGCPCPNGGCLEECCDNDPGGGGPGSCGPEDGCPCEGGGCSDDCCTDPGGGGGTCDPEDGCPCEGGGCSPNCCDNGGGGGDPCDNCSCTDTSAPCYEDCCNSPGGGGECDNCNCSESNAPCFEDCCNEPPCPDPGTCQGNEIWDTETCSCVCGGGDDDSCAPLCWSAQQCACIECGNGNSNEPPPPPDCEHCDCSKPNGGPECGSFETCCNEPPPPDPCANCDCEAGGCAEGCCNEPDPGPCSGGTCPCADGSCTVGCCNNPNQCQPPNCKCADNSCSPDCCGGGEPDPCPSGKCDCGDERGCQTECCDNSGGQASSGGKGGRSMCGVTGSGSGVQTNFPPEWCEGQSEYRGYGIASDYVHIDFTHWGTYRDAGPHAVNGWSNTLLTVHGKYPISELLTMAGNTSATIEWICHDQAYPNCIPENAVAWEVVNSMKRRGFEIALPGGGFGPAPAGAWDWEENMAVHAHGQGGSHDTTGINAPRVIAWHLLATSIERAICSGGASEHGRDNLGFLYQGSCGVLIYPAYKSDSETTGAGISGETSSTQELATALDGMTSTPGQLAAKLGTVVNDAIGSVTTELESGAYGALTSGTATWVERWGLAWDSAGDAASDNFWKIQLPWPRVINGQISMDEPLEIDFWDRLPGQPNSPLNGQWQEWLKMMFRAVIFMGTAITIFKMFAPKTALPGTGA